MDAETSATAPREEHGEAHMAEVCEQSSPLYPSENAADSEGRF